MFIDSKDFTTALIIRWLYFYGQNPIVLDINNPNDNIDIELYQNSAIEVLKIRDIEINFGRIKSVFFRRSGCQIPSQNYAFKFKPKSPEENSILEFLRINIISKKEILNFAFRRIKRFGDEHIGRINKIIALKYAADVKLKVPKTILAKSKKELQSFLSIEDKVIIKSQDLGYNYLNKREGIWRASYSRLITNDTLQSMPDKFSPSLFQSYIEKSFEIRAFYFNDKFFSVAIFSQSNEQTKVDYRNYDSKLPNREIPFNIPKAISNKLRKLFQLLDLNTGSVDLIFNGKDFYFLEINPVGQFDNVSQMGNWQIEMEIAKYLADEKE